MSESVCMQTRGSDLTFPTTMTLHFKERLAPPYDRDFCADEEQRVKVDDGDEVYSCQWNGIFRDRHPMTFRIFSANPPAAQEIQPKPTPVDLGTRIQLIHAFRNGKLVFKWVPPAQPVTEVLIHGRELEDNGIPHGAPLDIRVYPAGTGVPAELRALQVTERRDQLKKRLTVTTSIAIVQALPRTTDSMKCLVRRTQPETSAWSSARTSTS